MRYRVAAALLIASVASAAAQSYQTALPLSPAERRALEARLSTILEYSNADEVTDFALPSGRTITVLPYRMVNSRGGGRPCRGYRIDLEGESSRMAVDGFRCKRRNGKAWVIVEPELVLAQEGPNEQRPRNAQRRERRGTEEPLYADDDLFASPAEPGDTPPVPRPAPTRDDAVAADDTGSDGSAPQTAADEGQDEAGSTTIARSDGAQTPGDSPFASRVAAAFGDDQRSRREAERARREAERRALDLQREARQEAPARHRIDREQLARELAERTASNPRQAAEASTQRQTTSENQPGRFTTQPTRVVQRSQSTQTDDYSQNPKIVEGLQDLAYLRADEQATPDRVEAAVGEFAVDERFALPVSPDLLIARLDAAIERSETLPQCSESRLHDLCTLPQD